MRSHWYQLIAVPLALLAMFVVAYAATDVPVTRVPLLSPLAQAVGGGGSGPGPVRSAARRSVVHGRLQPDAADRRLALHQAGVRLHDGLRLLRRLQDDPGAARSDEARAADDLGDELRLHEHRRRAERLLAVPLLLVQPAGHRRPALAAARAGWSRAGGLEGVLRELPRSWRRAEPEYDRAVRRAVCVVDAGDASVRVLLPADADVPLAAVSVVRVQDGEHAAAQRAAPRAEGDAAGDRARDDRMAGVRDAAEHARHRAGDVYRVAHVLLLTAAMLFINVHHYFIDNVLWRFKDPEIRAHLLS